MTDDEVVRLPGVRLGLRWDGRPEDVAVTESRLTIVAGPGTDRFCDPVSGDGPVNAPALLAEPPDGDQQLWAHVTVAFRATFDAGVLLVWDGPDCFAKLCFERSPAGRPTIVTVVTRGTSDDANAYAVDRSDWWLRISTLGSAYAFHASPDGERWDLVRYFDLPGERRPRIGFLAQSPTGAGCRVDFDHIGHRLGRLEDLRGGD